MASKIQQLVSQARETFGKGETEPAFSEEMKALKEIVNSLTSEDFNLSQSVTQRPWDYLPYVQDSPASYMEVYHCPEFSLEIFLLKPYGVIPFHDHPNMHGVMKVLFNSMTVTSYSKVEGQALPRQGVPVVCKFLSQVVLDVTTGPDVLYPNVGNIHQIQSDEKAVAFFDILAPPYNPREGRVCNYYEKLDENAVEKTVRLMPGSNPSWFSCVPLPYDGPRP